MQKTHSYHKKTYICNRGLLLTAINLSFTKYYYTTAKHKNNMAQSLLTPIDSILPWIEANIWNIVGLLSLIVGILGLFGYKIIIPRTRKWRKKYIEDSLRPKFPKYIPCTSAEKKRSKDKTIHSSPNDEIIEGDIYIQPYFTTLPPNENEEPDLQITSPILFRDFFLNEVFKKQSKYNKVFCLVDDTGTGKTAALAHLLIDYINSHTKNNLPYDIRIFSLSSAEILDKIKKIELNNNKHIILLLDALDENRSIQEDPKKQKTFLEELYKIFDDERFAFIVFTCRRQFFKEISQEPDNDENNQWQYVNKLQLVPFNEQQIQEFLDKTFTTRSYNKQRCAAEDLINKHREIASRPIILTYIRDVIKSKRVLNTTLDFYDTIVESLLQHNIRRPPKKIVNPKLIQRWWNMTSEVAGYMYSHYKEHITYDELHSIIKKHNITLPNDTINKDLFQQRSLLTRNEQGFEFSHRSFYEYFLAYRFLQHPEEIKSVIGLNFSLQIFNQLYDAFSNGNMEPFFKLQTDIHEENFNQAYVSISNCLYYLNYYSEAFPRPLNTLDIFIRLSRTQGNCIKQSGQPHL